MCYQTVSKAFIRKHLLVRFVKKFHRRKNNTRAINKIIKRITYYQQLGQHIGIFVDIIQSKFKKPKLIIHPIKTEDTEDTEDSPTPRFLFPVDEIAAKAC